MAGINYSEKIPNNVGLANDRTLQRALEHWQPHFLQWWHDMGPTDFQQADVYLRTATSVDAKGWAQYGAVKMPEYRWGIFLADAVPERTIGFGDAMGQPAWQQVPGEYRSTLRRLIVTQGDTEPASVEQQRLLGHTCPSLYDLRNLFQVNVEEGRHLWAMVYLLHAYFGRDGREEAEALLERRSGDPDNPRILGAFNEGTPDWLALFMFTFFTDRDGKFQLQSLAESGFDPLARTCRFMLTEEAHHMFVGITGVARVIQRSCELISANPGADPRGLGVIDLPTVQKYLNFHFSVSLDLFGAELSSNAASYFSLGLKGRPNEAARDDDHRLADSAYPVPSQDGGRIASVEQAAINALNESLRDDYIADCRQGVQRWNRLIRERGVDFELRLPHKAFNRHIGVFAEVHATPNGELIDADRWNRERDQWLPTQADREFVRSLMPQAVVTPGRFAHWIAPPARGIDDRPLDFEYVRFA